MKIVLATGIYPPDIGGPATYVRELARELVVKGARVVVVTYGREETDVTEGTEESEEAKKQWPVVWVSRKYGPLLRWWRYVRALRTHAADADVVLAFSLVSVGVPLWLTGLNKPKLVLRLGGDFLWERYTDLGGSRGLREFYEKGFGSYYVIRVLSYWLLRQFDHIVFSTRFQEEMYEKHYKRLPSHAVIENALPAPTPGPSPAAAGEGRTRHEPFRLLFMGRFVAFKNLSALLRAMMELPGVTLTLVGEGPLQHVLEGNVRGLQLQDRVVFRPKVSPEERGQYFSEHDLLVIPSVTEISPNVALEARAVGLPVLLTEENGLSETLRHGMIVRKLRKPEEICKAIREVMTNYECLTAEAAKPPIERMWGRVCEEYLTLFHRIHTPHPNPLPLLESEPRSRRPGEGISLL